MELFDTHAHLTSSEMFPVMNEAIERAFASGVKTIVNICTDPTSLHRGLQIDRPGIYTAGCTPPHDVEQEGGSAFPLFEQTAREGKLVAIGETGLEYFHPGLDRKLQQKFLVRYLHLAASLKKPILFHCREAFSDLFSIVDLEYPKGYPAMLHCFSGTPQEAEEVLKRGWILSLSGIVTYKKNEMLREIAKTVPLTQLVLETDSPWLSPQSKRGKPNEPANIIETAECVAKVKGLSLNALAAATTKTARQFFCV
jgi:TatD DNase family protein